MSARAFVVLALALCVAPCSAYAQDRSVVFVHGYRSGADTWSTTASRLQADYQIQATAKNTNSTAVYQTQAADLQAQIWSLPTNTVAVGHSNGGIVARQMSRGRSLGAIFTIGTPHQGSYLAVSGNAARLVSFHTELMLDASFLASFLRYAFGNHWVIDAIEALGEGYLNDGVGYLTGFVSHVANPVLTQMGPLSSFRENLNATTSQEPATRVSLAIRAPRYWEGGLVLGLAPDWRDNYVTVKAVAVQAYSLAGQYLISNYAPYSQAWANGMQALDAADLLTYADSEWCLTPVNT